MKSKICKSCEEEFDPRCSTQVYCTDECRVKSVRYQPVEKICAREECSNAFKTSRTRHNQTYCSRSCSASVNNSKSPKRERTIIRLDSCLRCSKELGRSSTKYCSILCQRGAENDAKLKTWLKTGEAPKVRGGSNHYIRKHVMVEQEGKCSICSMPPMWNGQLIVFIMDHIDGNSENNRRDNLRLVCPNCDSQLPTYKAKNRGNGRHFRRERYAAGQSY